MEIKTGIQALVQKATFSDSGGTPTTPTAPVPPMNPATPNFPPPPPNLGTAPPVGSAPSSGVAAAGACGSGVASGSIGPQWEKVYKRMCTESGNYVLVEVENPEI